MYTMSNQPEINLEAVEGQYNLNEPEAAEDQPNPNEPEAVAAPYNLLENEHRAVEGQYNSNHPGVRLKRSESHTMAMTQEELYENAAMYLEEGEHHRPFEHHPTTRKQVKAYKAANAVAVNLIDLLAGLALLALALFEDPAVYQLPVTVCALFEIFLLHCLLIHSILHFRWKGCEGLKEIRILIKNVLIVEMLVEALVVLSTQQHHVRIMRAFRPLLLLAGRYTKGTNRVVSEIWQSLFYIIDVLILLLVFVTTFAVLGLYLFSEDSQTDDYSGDLKNWYFEDLASSWTNLFILTTTANYPDIMMPSLKKHVWAPVFFMCFIMIGNYFIGSLLLSVVFNSFKKKFKKKFGNLYRHRRRGLRLAFKAVCQENSNEMDFNTFKGIMKAYKRIEEIKCSCRRKKQYKAVISMFYALKKKERDHLTLEEWLNLPQISCCSWIRRQNDTDQYPGLFFGTKKYPSKLQCVLLGLRKCLKSEIFEYFVFLVILINASFIVAEALTLSAANVYEEFFLAVYTIEVALKITSFGPRHFWRSAFNKLDLLVVVMGLIGQSVNGGFAFFATLRMFRLLRLLRLQNSFLYTLYAVFELLPKMKRFLVTLMLAYFFFAIIGMESFSGLLSKCGCVTRNDSGSVQCQPELFQNHRAYTFVVNNSSNDECDPTKRNCTMLLCDSVPNCFVLRCGRYYGGYYDRSSADGLFYFNNFDNLLRSYVTLFEIMVVNNWQVTMQGTVDAVRYFRPGHPEQLSRAYFIFFYLITVIIMTNVITSFIITIFDTLRPSLKQRNKDKKAKYRRLRNLLSKFPREKFLKLLSVFPCMKKKTKEKKETKEQEARPGPMKKFTFNVDKKKFDLLMSECGFPVESTTRRNSITEDHRSDDSPYLVTGIRPLSTLYIYEEIFQHKLEKWNAKEAKQAADCYCVHDYV